MCAFSSNTARVNSVEFLYIRALTWSGTFSSPTRSWKCFFNAFAFTIIVPTSEFVPARFLMPIFSAARNVAASVSRPRLIQAGSQCADKYSDRKVCASLQSGLQSSFVDFSNSRIGWIKSNSCSRFGCRSNSDNTALHAIQVFWF